MRIVFFGTPDFAVPFLEALAASRHQVAAVATQPDRPRGRGMRLQPTPVKRWAEARGLPVLQPERARDPRFLEAVASYRPDAIVLVAYGQIIPRELLELPPRGCINVHPSLLPRHRGASPVQAAILAGDTVTGVTTMYMDEGLDTGDIILQAELPIREDDTAGSLEERLIAIGVPLLLETLDLVERGEAPRRPQREEEATYAPRLDKRDGFLDWSAPAQRLERTVRAFQPAPGAYTVLGRRRIRVLKAAAGPGGDVEAAPGTILAAGPEGVTVQTGDGVLRLLEVQPENSRAMGARDFANGYRLQPGQRFGNPPA